jgi:hypothetical protein
MAEFQGGIETNLNQHVPASEAELIFPGERGVAEPKNQIRLSELTVRHDLDSDEVYIHCDRLAKRVIPVYLGMLHPFALPELQITMLHFSAPSFLSKHLFSTKRPVGVGVHFYPRMRYKHVVVERASWEVDLQVIPKRNAEDTDYEFLLRLAKWRKAVGIQREVFVSVHEGARESSSGSSRIFSTIDTGRKPFYLDFESPFCVDIFERRMHEKKGYVKFSELMPTSSDAVITCGGNKYISEFIVEITQSG